MPKFTPTSDKPKDTYCLFWDDLAQMGWSAANFVTVVGLTSAAISVLHNPMNVYMYTKVSNTPLVMSNIWNGIGAYYVATMTRMGYITGARKIERIKNLEDNEANVEKPHDLTTLNSRKPIMTIPEKVLYFSLGEVFTVQISEVLSQIRKLPLEHLKNFVWHTKYNVYQLSVTTVGARFCFGYINFLSLCKAEPFYASKININDPTLNHLCAGAASGVTAALFSFPFSYYRDYSLSKVTVVNGNISVLGTLNTLNILFKDITNLRIMKIGVEQLLPRLLRTSTRFALLAGIGTACGEEPLGYFFPKKDKSIGFFSQNNNHTLDPNRILDTDKSKLDSPSTKP